MTARGERIVFFTLLGLCLAGGWVLGRIDTATTAELAAARPRYQFTNIPGNTAAVARLDQFTGEIQIYVFDTASQKWRTHTPTEPPELPVPATLAP